ncbi:hypothetical protein Tco_1071859 [Tanacetum coccineum]
MSLADHPDVIRAFCSFVGIKTYGWLCHLRLIEVMATRQRSGNTFVGTPCWMTREVLQPKSGYDLRYVHDTF